MADEFSGFEALGFDNFSDLPILMKAMVEWQVLCEEGDMEKCKAWFAAAPLVVRKSLISSKHEMWCRLEEALTGIVGSLEAMGISLPVEALSQVLHTIHEGIHDLGRQVLDQVQTPQPPTISPEDNARAFSILGKVFGEMPEGPDNGHWI